MTRTARLKLFYLASVAALGVVAGGILFITPEDNRVAVMIVLALLLFLPGRIQGVIMREHFRGRRLADLGHFEESLRESEAFLSRLAREPWRKRAVWLGGAAYSRDIEAMTLNNAGIAALHLGRFEQAEAHFRRALALDPEYAIPHLNLAVLANIRGDSAGAESELSEAARLGYRGSSVDAVLQQAQQIQAAIASPRRHHRE